MDRQCVFLYLFLFVLPTDIHGQTLKGRPSDVEVCSYKNGASLPHDEKGVALKEFLKSQREKKHTVLCHRHMQWAPIARVSRIPHEAPKRLVGIRVIEFHSRFYAQAPVQVLRGITAHELSHYGVAQDGYCEELLGRNWLHAYARCELGVDRRASERVGLCITHASLQFVHDYIQSVLPYESLEDLEERINWFKVNANCSQMGQN